MVGNKKKRKKEKKPPKYLHFFSLTKQTHIPFSSHFSPSHFPSSNFHPNQMLPDFDNHFHATPYYTFKSQNHLH